MWFNNLLVILEADTEGATCMYCIVWSCLILGVTFLDADTEAVYC